MSATTVIAPTRTGQTGFIIDWGFCLLFYFGQYALRSAPGVMVPELTTAFGLTTLGVSSLVGLYYYTYSTFAIIAGASMDRYGPEIRDTGRNTAHRCRCGHVRSRFRGRRRGRTPVARCGVRWTLVLLFGFQGEQILTQPLIILILAVPIVIQVYFNAGLAYWLNRACGSVHNVAAPSALIGASNFFELAVATAISLFGFHSGAALATLVGVLVEVPVMLSNVRIVMATRNWYTRA